MHSPSFSFNYRQPNFSLRLIHEAPGLLGEKYPLRIVVTNEEEESMVTSIDITLKRLDCPGIATIAVCIDKK